MHSECALMRKPNFQSWKFMDLGYGRHVKNYFMFSLRNFIKYLLRFHSEPRMSTSQSHAAKNYRKNQNVGGLGGPKSVSCKENGFERGYNVDSFT